MQNIGVILVEAKIYTQISDVHIKENEKHQIDRNYNFYLIFSVKSWGVTITKLSAKQQELCGTS